MYYFHVGKKTNPNSIASPPSPYTTNAKISSEKRVAPNMLRGPSCSHSELSQNQHVLITQDFEGIGLQSCPSLRCSYVAPTLEGKHHLKSRIVLKVVWH